MLMLSIKIIMPLYWSTEVQGVLQNVAYLEKQKRMRYCRHSNCSRAIRGGLEPCEGIITRLAMKFTNVSRILFVAVPNSIQSQTLLRFVAGANGKW